MGALFRSEDMVLVRLYFERVAAHATVDELGALGLVQFKDLNPDQSAFQRTFSADIRRCDEMQRRLRFLVKQSASLPADSRDTYHFDPVGPHDTSSIRLDDLDKHLGELERSLLEMNAHASSLNAQCNELVELRYVLEKAAEFFAEEAPRASSAEYGTLGVFDPISSPRSMRGADPPVPGELLLSDPTAASANAAKSIGILSFHAGVIEKEKVSAFERVLFRATRGNCFPRFADLPEPLTDPTTGETVQKAVFVIFFSGNEVRTKTGKICSAFGANRYPFPDDYQEQMAAYSDCRARISDLKQIIATTDDQRRDTLGDITGKLGVWKEKVRKEKAIFHTLNLLNFDTSNKLFIADGWCPTGAIGDVRQALDAGRRRSNAQVPSILEERHHGHETPPTHFKINKFTSVFHSIVESYGVAQYHEANPAVFTVVTFPFLFAIMFGDIGHGIIMAAFALWLIMSERKLQGKKLNEFLQTCYDGRYIIILMGIFSVYTGFIYNEAFAVPLDLFGTRWKHTEASPMACGIDNCEVPGDVLPPIKPYPFGFDPIWKDSENGLLFFNSYKMKLSIVLGVSQMVLGICMSYVNARFYKEPIDVLYVFIPQMIFMNAIFGYLVFLIILKWLIDWNAPSCVADPNCDAPDIKGILIAMFMSPGTLPPKMQMFPGQGLLQSVLLLAALVSVPWMLFPKPLLLKARHDKKRGYRPLEADGDGSGSIASKASAKPVVDDDDIDHGTHEPFDFTDCMVNQMIHTIEFVLGAVSNTASYLRLWALSLAHAELSDVFLQKLLVGSLASGNPILILVGFVMWAGATLGVLMGMESLSAFLHALRLHWVEFQNKFYNLHGAGTKFIPFSFAALADEEE